MKRECRCPTYGKCLLNGTFGDMAGDEGPFGGEGGTEGGGKHHRSAKARGQRPLFSTFCRHPDTHVSAA